MWKREEPKKSPSLKYVMEDDIGAVVGTSTGGFFCNCLESRKRKGRAGVGTLERGKEIAAAAREREGKSRERRGRGKERVVAATYEEGKREQGEEKKMRKWQERKK